MRLDPPEIVAEVGRLGTAGTPTPDFPLLAIGIREVRSQNSWMHNSPTLMKGDRRQRTRINPRDAGAAGIVEGGRVRITSKQGHIETDVLITDDVLRRHHRRPARLGTSRAAGSWPTACRGANVNELTSNRPEDLEQLAGMSVLNGVAVRIEAVASSGVRGPARRRRRGPAPRRSGSGRRAPWPSRSR